MEEAVILDAPDETTTKAVKLVMKILQQEGFPDGRTFQTASIAVKRHSSRAIPEELYENFISSVTSLVTKYVDSPAEIKPLGHVLFIHFVSQISWWIVQSRPYSQRARWLIMFDTIAEVISRCSRYVRKAFLEIKSDLMRPINKIIQCILIGYCPDYEPARGEVEIDRPIEAHGLELLTMMRDTIVPCFKELFVELDPDTRLEESNPQPNDDPEEAEDFLNKFVTRPECANILSWILTQVVQYPKEHVKEWIGGFIKLKKSDVGQYFLADETEFPIYRMELITSVLNLMDSDENKFEKFPSSEVLRVPYRAFSCFARLALVLKQEPEAANKRLQYFRVIFEREYKQYESYYQSMYPHIDWTEDTIFRNNAFDPMSVVDLAEYLDMSFNLLKVFEYEDHCAIVVLFHRLFRRRAPFEPRIWQVTGMLSRRIHELGPHFTVRKDATYLASILGSWYLHLPHIVGLKEVQSRCGGSKSGFVAYIRSFPNVTLPDHVTDEHLELVYDTLMFILEDPESAKDAKKTSAKKTKAKESSSSATSAESSSSSAEPPTTTSECVTCHKSEGELMLCGGCKAVAYCSRDCQRQDWANHKTFCKTFQDKIQQFTRSIGRPEAQASLKITL